tara:strand:- start:2538 stop:2804 length:267 start_codon:yes stop_codon:yes gene_type:complete
MKTNKGIKMKDVINPEYYNKGIEVTEFIFTWKLNFCEGNIIKYICRWRYKNGLEDLLKAKKYLELQIEYVEEQIAHEGGFVDADEIGH